MQSKNITDKMNLGKNINISYLLEGSKFHKTDTPALRQRCYMCSLCGTPSKFHRVNNHCFFPELWHKNIEILQHKTIHQGYCQHTIRNSKIMICSKILVKIKETRQVVSLPSVKPWINRFKHSKRLKNTSVIIGFIKQ